MKGPAVGRTLAAGASLGRLQDLVPSPSRRHPVGDHRPQSVCLGGPKSTTVGCAVASLRCSAAGYVSSDFCGFLRLGAVPCTFADALVQESCGRRDGQWCLVCKSAAQSRFLRGLGAKPCPGVVGRGEASCRQPESAHPHPPLRPRDQPLAEGFSRSLGVRAPRPAGDRAGGDPGRGGRRLPHDVERGQAAPAAGAGATARRAPRRATCVSRLSVQEA
jgi:hypothetical protein